MMDLNGANRIPPGNRNGRTLPTWLSSATNNRNIDQSVIVKEEVEEVVDHSNPVDFAPHDLTSFVNDVKPVISQPNHFSEIIIKEEVIDNEVDHSNPADFASHDLTSFVNDVKPVIPKQNDSPENVGSSTSISITSANVPMFSHSTVQSPDDSSVNNRRPACQYRRKCYRTNEQHKKDFSHAGDSDYDNQSDCDSSSNDGAAVAKPRCWFGKNCYRKNEEHKRKFHHSPPSNIRTSRATQTRPECSDDEYEDSFIDNNSSDEWLSNSDDEIEAGFSDFENYSSSDDDDDNAGFGKPKKKKFSIF